MTFRASMTAGSARRISSWLDALGERAMLGACALGRLGLEEASLLAAGVGELCK
jgi:hypothetical protein